MWSNIINQDRVKNILKNIYKNGRLAHAYIFYGSEGTGKDAAAIEFAKLVNCENGHINNEACDNCPSCLQFKSLNSSTIKFITALPAGKKETDNDDDPLTDLDEKDYKVYKEEIEKKMNDPYHKMSIPKANNIRISSIRNIRKNIYLTGVRGKKKIFIISDCDLMNPQSSNALLKILEEPPGDSLLLLTTSRLNSLLPTIIGRCQKIRFDSIPKEDIRKYIKQKNPSVSDNEAGFFAELADGSISKANNILESYMLELREHVVELLVSIVTGKALKMGDSIDYALAGKSKEKIRQFLMLLIIWFRDLMFDKHHEKELVINRDIGERLTKFNARYTVNNYKVISYIEEAMRELDMNINPELILYRLSHNIREEIEEKEKV
jgi:DNA polymerase-3 subunit delta'